MWRVRELPRFQRAAFVQHLRAGRSQQQLRGADKVAHGADTHHAAGGQVQGVYHRRGAHAVNGCIQRAFLKTLEEPPKHVIFILATTEKHKILPTILSRCQIYDFERMTVENTIAHLKMVAQKEGILTRRRRWR